MTPPSLTGLLGRWEDAYVEGRDLPAADLCPDHPNLAPDLQKAIDALKRVRQVLGEGADQPDLTRRGGVAPRAPVMHDGTPVLDMPHEVKDHASRFRADFLALRREIAKVIVGHDAIVQDTLTALVGGGHALLEGVPGLGKTLLVRTLADALLLKFQRIQFTPDLMPADLIGTNMVIETADRQRKFEFQPGPIFGNVLLADEINRATPKTQSALLEAMQECSVTVTGQTHQLPRPFFVLATQNPLEMEGTYPLPEAQLDRFFFKLLVRYPSGSEIEAILDRTTEARSARVEPVLSGQRILEMTSLVRHVPVAAEVRGFGVKAVLGTHPDNPLASPLAKRYVRYGASPRGAQAMILAAKIRALLDQRYHVAREDVAAVAHAALRHRLILNFEAQADGVAADTVIDDVLQHVGKVASGEVTRAYSGGR